MRVPVLSSKKPFLRWLLFPVGVTRFMSVSFTRGCTEPNARRCIRSASSESIDSAIDSFEIMLCALALPTPPPLLARECECERDKLGDEYGVWWKI